MSADAARTPGHAERLQAVIDRAMIALESYVRQNPAAPSPAAEPGSPWAVDRLAAGLALSPYELDVLALTVATQIGAEAPQLCALAHRDPAKTYMTLGLGRAALNPPPAIDPEQTLKAWRLVETAGPPSLHAPLRVPETVVSFLRGGPGLDESLLARVTQVARPPSLDDAERACADRLARMLRTATVAPVLAGDEVSALSLAAAAGDEDGLGLFRLSEALLPQEPGEMLRLARTWRRDHVLTGAILAIAVDDDSRPRALREALLGRFLAEAGGGVILVGEQAAMMAAEGRLPLVRIQTPTASPQGALHVWRDLAEGLMPDDAIVDLARRHRLSSAALAGRLEAVLADPSDPAPLPERLDRLCREQARGRLEALAHRLEPQASLDDLILPADARATLDQIVAHCRNRARVLEDWGFSGAGARGLGLSVMFAGPSGVGKTMAAEALAQALQLDLFRIDLSTVVDKYIGETEKNLRRLFDAADESGAILLFDEADALFGKRSETRDSHDRGANIEVGYLLQRIEAYRGVAILTTNLPGALDPAFQRRLAYVLHFPFPDEAVRREIWRRVFPDRAPREDLSLDALARLSLSGGQIRTVALNAAMLASEERGPISMAHIAAAAATERDKQGRPWPTAERKGWPA